jgi:hypothetical protein
MEYPGFKIMVAISDAKERAEKDISEGRKIPHCTILPALPEVVAAYHRKFNQLKAEMERGKA